MTTELLETDSATLKKIWNQKQIPVILRRTGVGQRLRVRLPYDETNRAWLQNGRHIAPEWIALGKFWELPKAWFNDFVDRALEGYGKVFVIQPYREQEKCADRCLNANGHECQCSCMGRNHGSGNDGSWFEVTDTFATRWGDEQIACRLLVSTATS